MCSSVLLVFANLLLGIIIDHVDGDLKNCNVYAAEGLMSIAHDFVKLDDITYGLKGSKNSLEFEFSVLGTEEASVYFSPQPIGQFGFRRGYGVLVDETRERNASLVIRKYEPHKNNYDLKLMRQPKLLFIGEIFQITVNFNYDQKYGVEICVFVDDSSSRKESACTTDINPIHDLAYVTFFSDIGLVNYNFFNCSNASDSSSFEEAFEPSEIWFPFCLVIISLLFFVILFQGFRLCRASKQLDLQGTEFNNLPAN